MSMTPLSSLLSSAPIKGLIVTGTVIDNNDPLKLLRIRVRVPQIHAKIEDSDLPWARPVSKAGPMGMSGAVSGISVPAIGSRVFIQFTDSSVYAPAYIGDIVDASSMAPELLEDYPDSYGFIDAAGNLFFVNTKQGTIRLVHVSGSTINIEQNGSINIVSADKVVMSGTKSVEVIGAKFVNISGGDAVDMRAARIDLNRSTSGSKPIAVVPRSKPELPSVSGKTNL